MNDLTPLSEITEVIEKRRKRAVVRNDNRAIAASTVRILVGVGIAVILFVILFGFRIVDGNDMYPALSDGDLVLTYFKPSYTKNEIVIYTVGGKEYCGRIVAKEGDNVDFSADGKLYVNGTPQTTDVTFPTYAPDKWKGLTVVPEGAVYILGDYRTASIDSRVFGFIPKDNIQSKVIALLRHKKI